MTSARPGGSEQGVIRIPVRSCAMWSLGLVVPLVVALGIAWCGYIVFTPPKWVRINNGCQTNLKHLCQGMRMYAKDCGGHLPPAGRWVELTKPYVRPERSYTCPAAPKLPVGYAYADHLAGHDPAKERYAAKVYMLWDGRPGSLSPEYRHVHRRGVTVGYLDGHVKLLWPEETFAKAVEWDKVLVGGQLPPARDRRGTPVPDKGVERKQPDGSRRPSP
jgi:prepilin-type processing-associated H-X9-DG protein